MRTLTTVSSDALIERIEQAQTISVWTGGKNHDLVIPLNSWFFEHRRYTLEIATVDCMPTQLPLNVKPKPTKLWILFLHWDDKYVIAKQGGNLQSTFDSFEQQIKSHPPNAYACDACGKYDICDTTYCEACEEVHCGECLSECKEWAEEDTTPSENQAVNLQATDVPTYFKDALNRIDKSQKELAELKEEVVKGALKQMKNDFENYAYTQAPDNTPEVFPPTVVKPDNTPGVFDYSPGHKYAMRFGCLRQDCEDCETVKNKALAYYIYAQNLEDDNFSGTPLTPSEYEKDGENDDEKTA